MTEIVIKIMAELISVLALATKQINQGRFSTSVLVYDHSCLICCREICKEFIGGKGHWVSITEA